MLGSFRAPLSAVDQPFDLSLQHRLRHTWLLGATGTGKTTLLHNLMVSDIENGHGIALLDPHGDEAHFLLDCIPPDRVQDVIYFSPRDTKFPVSWNPLHHVPQPARHLVAEQL